MKYVYPAIFTEEDGKYLVTVPNLNGCHTFGSTLLESIEMARDAIAMWLCVAEDSKETIPTASPVGDLINVTGFVNLIDVDTAEYRRINDTRAVKKTLSVPSWLNAQAELAGINFSQVLQEGLKTKLNIGQ